MDGPEIPPYFICPISLQIMKDPVTISTGVSYDRDSIHCWLSTYNHNKCPVTNQPLGDPTLTPNSTLLRLIRSWAATAANKNSNSMPKPAFNLSDILRELVEASKNPDVQIRSLKKIITLIQADADMECMEKASVCSLVASLITMPEPLETAPLTDCFDMIGEAMAVLHLLNPSDEVLKLVSERKNGELITTLSLLLQRGTYRARIHVALLLRTIFTLVDDTYKRELPSDLFDGVVEILKDQNSNRKMTMAVLSILTEVVSYRKNRDKAVESGVVAVIVELLVEEREERRRCEAMLWVLELVCQRAEGRSAVVGHPAGVAAVGAKVLAVSCGATARAVRVLFLLCKFNGGGGVVEEMMDVGGVAKLCMVVQVEVSRKVRGMAKDILGMHLKAWSKYPCFHSYCSP